MNPLMAIGPIDGRYHDVTKVLAPYFSESALTKCRVFVMTEHLLALSRHPQVPLRALTKGEILLVHRLQKISPEDAEIIKAIEKTGYGTIKRTNHDVKACELYLRMKFAETSLADVVEWIHFGRTSEDVDNCAYAIMIRGAMRDILAPILGSNYGTLKDFATRYADLPMLARTHGQPATPTTLGKEFNVHARRLVDQLKKLPNHKIQVKSNGASGNDNAACVAIPEVDWPDFAHDFLNKCLNRRTRPRILVNPVTTQVESFDSHAELFEILERTNTILTGLCQDLWRYISDEWFVQVAVPGEVGSSTMPQKVNPIELENAWGNLGMANALLGFFCEKLPVSWLQRDLSGSTVRRNIGVAFAHCLIAYQSIAKGLGKISANEPKILQALADHPEVIAEAYQTILRVAGFPKAYDALKDLVRGKKVSMDDLHEFVRGLDVPEEVKARMLAVTPRNYIGFAPRLARM